MATLGWCTCGKVSEFGDLLAGKQVRCMYCGENLALPPAHACATCATCAGKYEAALGACPRCAPSQAAPLPAPAADPGPRIAAGDPTKCPSCGSPLPASALMCRWCRKDLRVTKARFPPAPAPAPPRPAGLPPPPGVRFPAPESAGGIPWEDREVNVFVRWWKTWAGTQFGFDDFWKNVPWSGGHASPITFVLFFLAQVGILVGTCGVPLILMVLAAGAETTGPRTPSTPVACGLIVLGIPVAVLSVVLYVYLFSLVQHGACLLLGGQGSYEATLRAVAYSYGASVWGIIPYVGGLAQLAFHVLTLTHALPFAHGISKGRAVAAAILPMLVCCLMSVGAMFAFMAIASSAGR